MGDMTKNFNRSEFACKCGCGKNNIDSKPPKLAQKVRDKLNMPVRVNSGVRCEKRNRAVGGVENSYHVQGLAADLSCKAGGLALFLAIANMCDSGELDGPLIGWLVDLVCEELNWLSDNDFRGLELTEQEAAAIVEGICYSVADVPYSEGVKESANERIEEIEARIGAARRLEDAPGAPDVAESENDHTPWQTPFWNEGSKPVLTPPLSEEERQRREANFQKAIEFVLKWIERRNFNVVNSEPVMKAAIGDDGHGPVAWGISIPTLKAAYLAGVVGHWNIGKLTKAEAKDIYRKYFWDRYGWGELDWPVCLCCLDASINHSGFPWILQMALNDCGKGTPIDGKFGPKVFAALKTCEPRELAAAIIRHNREYCEQIAALDTSMQHLDAMAREAGVAVEETEEDNVD